MGGDRLRRTLIYVRGGRRYRRRGCGQLSKTVSGGGPVSTASMTTRLVSMCDGFGSRKVRTVRGKQT